MPISAINGCDEGHWAEVLSIITDAANVAGFEARLVSQSDEVGVIQKNIIQNLYQNDIVICDVSGKNANVMFELGMRLAFDKPTIIIKDDVTSYSFDTSPVEHLGYPRDLRFAKIVTFKQVLASKIRATCEAASKQANYSPFLKHFGDFTVAKIETKELGAQDYILSEIRRMSDVLSKIASRPAEGRFQKSDEDKAWHDVTFTIRTADPKLRRYLSEQIKQIPSTVSLRITEAKEETQFDVGIRASSDMEFARSHARLTSLFDQISSNLAIKGE